MHTILAARLKDWINWAVPLVAAPFICALLVTRAGTLDALLFILFLLCMHRLCWNLPGAVLKRVRT